MQENNTFFDKNMMKAILVCFALMFAYEFYMRSKAPNPAPTAEVTENVAASPSPEVAKQIPDQPPSVVESKSLEVREESLSSYEGENLMFSVSSKGMGLKDIRLKSYTTRENELVSFFDGGEIAPFETTLSEGKPLYFTVKKESENTFVGAYEDADFKIRKTYQINDSQYFIASTVEIETKSGQIPSVSHFLVDKTDDEPDASIFNPSFERQEIFVLADNTKEREIYHIHEPLNQQYTNVAIASLNSHYFATAIIDKSEVIPSLRAYQSTAKAEVGPISYAQLIYPVVNASKAVLNYISYVGPKKMSIVSQVDDRFTDVVDFGFFSFIAKPILKLLNFFYSFLQNYGLAIILLTILVRVLVLPFNVMSYKSMKGMQKIQPLIAQVKEKYKDDPTKMNVEMMSLFKEHKVNPMGGCLPMLLQLPIFIALYQVLGQSIELYQSPFYFWIKDLSLKDPFYILPILMGITMYLQQKLTPTTLDPTQQKVMMVMPLIFTGMMVALPSGLTLYIFVSTLFAVVQQKILMSKA